MPPAANLPEAASDAFDNLHTLWLADTLKTKLVAFVTAVLPLFPQVEPGGRPVSNWATLIYSLASQMPSTNVPYDGLITSADQVYRLCWITNQLGVVQTGQITSAQATAVLAAYNLQFT